jgi:glycine cleavage system transcriptional repressor
MNSADQQQGQQAKNGETATRYVLTLIGQDRPGIVAAVSRVLADAGCNIEQSSMALLGGVFVVLLVVSVPHGAERALRVGLVGMTTMEGFLTHVDPYPDEPSLRQTVEGEPYSLSLHGADHPGIVADVTGLLAAHGVNIVDLSTELIQGRVPVYVMTMDLILPPAVDPADLDRRLQDLSRRIDCAITLRRVESITL